jgi:hypothetical protein
LPGEGRRRQQQRDEGGGSEPHRPIL